MIVNHNSRQEGVKEMLVYIRLGAHWTFWSRRLFFKSRAYVTQAYRRCEDSSHREKIVFADKKNCQSAQTCLVKIVFREVCAHLGGETAWPKALKAKN